MEECGDGGGVGVDEQVSKRGRELVAKVWGDVSRIRNSKKLGRPTTQSPFSRSLDPLGAHKLDERLVGGLGCIWGHGLGSIYHQGGAPTMALRRRCTHFAMRTV